MKHAKDQIQLTQLEAISLVRLLQSVAECDELPNSDPIATEADELSNNIADHLHQMRAEFPECWAAAHAIFSQEG